MICEDVDNIFVSFGKNPHFARTQSDGEAENTQATDKWRVKLTVKKYITLRVHINTRYLYFS